MFNPNVTPDTTPATPTNIVAEMATLLEGFEYVESDGLPSITLDPSRRFYLSVAVRKMLRVKPGQLLTIKYNPLSKSIAIILNGDYFDTHEHHMSQFNIDQRYYLSARHFANQYSFTPERAPYHFDYVKGSSDGGVFIFKLREVRI